MPEVKLALIVTVTSLGHLLNMLASKEIKIFAIFVALFQIATLTSSFKFNDCSVGKKPDARLQNASVSTCLDTNQRFCPLVRGHNASIEVDFFTCKYNDQHVVELDEKCIINYVVARFSLSG